MTSLTGLKLSSQLGAWLGRPLEDVLVWNYGTLESLVTFAAAPPLPKADPIDAMPDDEVAQLLARELGQS
jgi:hypothetical protein